MRVFLKDELISCMYVLCGQNSLFLTIGIKTSSLEVWANHKKNLFFKKTLTKYIDKKRTCLEIQISLWHKIIMCTFLKHKIDLMVIQLCNTLATLPIAEIKTVSKNGYNIILKL